MVPFPFALDLVLFLKLCTHAYVCGFVPVSTGAQRGQKKAWDLLELELRVVTLLSCPKWVFWELNLGPLQEQLVLLGVEPSLQPLASSYCTGTELNLLICTLGMELP